MKKRLSLVLSLVMMLSLVLTACGGGGDQGKVVEDFVGAVSEADADKVAELCTDNFKAEAAMVVMGIAMMKAEDEKFSIEASDIKVTEEKDDTCKVTFKLKMTSAEGEKEEESTATLKKVDDKWLMDGME